MTWIAPLADLLFPATCPGCGARAPGVCGRCLASARPAPGPPTLSGLDWWVAVFAYEGAVREALARAKYRNARAALPALAGLLIDRLRAEGAPGGISALDGVTWPPTTPQRRRRRGFDQAEYLARAVADGLGLPARPLLSRGPGPPQTGRSRRERAEGPVFVPRRVTGRVLLLVDDVGTTGATLVSAAGALRRAGAMTVGAATVARTPHPAARRPSGQDRLGAAQGTGREGRYQR